jgi:PAS domain S-box-containing protein
MHGQGKRSLCRVYWVAEGNLPIDFKVFEFLADAVVIVNEKQAVVYLNEAAAQFYNTSKEEGIGRQRSELFSEEWLRREEKEAYDASLTQKNAWSGECYHVNRQGQKFLISASVSNMTDDLGKKLGAIYVVRQKSSKEQTDSLSPTLDLDKQELANIIDTQALQSIMDNVYAVTKIGFAVIDLNGNILAANGWQDICTKFHRVNPQSLWNCLESDLVLTQGVAPGEFRAYKCKNNMWDFVTPIMIGNKHVGNLFSGQFFFDDETIDRKVFELQAEKYGFNKEAYIAALDKVPRRNREEVKNLMQFYVKLAEMISKLSYGNLRLSKSLSDQKKIERELRQSQHDLNHAQDVAKTGSWRLNVQTNQLVWSDETYRIFGVPLGTPVTYEKFLKTLHPDDKEMVDTAWKAAVRGESYDIEHRIIVEDEVFWVHEKAELEFDNDGTLIGGFGTAQDITAHKQDAERLQHLNRALRAISDGNQAITRATDEAAFVHQACRIVVEDCGYSLVWIGVAVDDEEKTVKPMAYAGFDQGYIDALNITWGNIDRGSGPTGAAIRTGKVQVCNDMRCDPKFAPWRKQALERGYASSVALPFVYNEKAFGCLTIYSREANVFSEEEVKLLSELTSDLSNGIMLLRMRAVNEQTQKALQVSEEKYRQIVETAEEGIWLAKPNGTTLFVNQKMVDILGYKSKEMLGKSGLEFMEKDQEQTILETRKLLDSNFRTQLECKFIRKDGNVVWTLANTAPIFNEQGVHVANIAMHTDITKRKEAEDTLVKARKEWERIFDALPDYIAVVDNKHRILRVNKAMADKLKVTPEQAFGLRCYGCVHGTETWLEDCPHTQSMQDGKIHTAKLYEEKLGGDLIVTTTPLKDEKGRIIGTVHVARPAKDKK